MNMTVKAAMWIHGTSANVENPNSLIPNGIVRRGSGTSFFAHSGSFNWFHLAVPTPVYVDDQRPLLSKVFVFYKLTSGSIKSVHLWDGPSRVRTLDGLDLHGDHSVAIDDANGWGIDPLLTIRYGLGISVGVQFNINMDTPDTLDKLEFLITTAGADFAAPLPPPRAP
jgi:hypothetical protein